MSDNIPSIIASNRSGQYQFSQTGEEGAGRFDCPHGIAVDPRSGKDNRLLMADRGLGRMQDFDWDGIYLGSWGSDIFHSSKGFDFRGDLCAMSELYGRVTIFDGQNRVVESIGEQANAHHLPPWSNVDSALLHPGLINSPNAAAWGHNGEIYLVEWINHGRASRMDRARKGQHS